MKTQILAVAPYPGMGILMRKAAEGRTDMELEVIVGDMDQGLRAVQDANHNNFDVVVSRGGTAKLIADCTDIPVIEISISIFDVLRSIKMAESYTDKFAVVGFPELTSCTQTLCNLLQLEIKIIPINRQTNVSQCLRQLQEGGFDLVVCDMVVSTVAKEVGMHSILVLSSVESISVAFDHAIKLSRAFNYTRRQKEILRTVFSLNHEEIFVFYDNGKLWFSTLLEDSNEEEISEEIKAHFDELLLDSNCVVEKKENNSLVIYQCKHIEVYGKKYIMVVRSHTELFSTCSNDKNLMPYDRRSFLVGSILGLPNRAIGAGDLVNQIEHFGKVAFPVLIVGEDGTGKNRTASMLYNNSTYNSHPFYVIDCCSISSRKWHFLLSNADSPFHDVHSTLYFKNAEKLSSIQAEELLNYLFQSSLCTLNRLLFSFSSNKVNVQELPLYKQLIEFHNGIVLNLKPLRERRNDIPVMAVMYLNQLNIELGKNLVGFEKEAMKMLQMFLWPGNLDQLKRVIRELAIMSDTPYISPKLVNEVLQAESPVSLDVLPDGYAAVNLNQLLHDINHDIVRLVLAEENGNQSKTASRLGISRSTLWRMLS